VPHLILPLGIGNDLECNTSECRADAPILVFAGKGESIIGGQGLGFARAALIIDVEKEEMSQSQNKK
jgi:hypothetical protein